MNDYAQFLAGKRALHQSSGLEVDPESVNPMLFPFQRDLTLWALRKGRAALFCDTGLGKTFMQLEWARLLGVPALIIAPLSVARQTVREAAKLGINAAYCRSHADVRTAITVTNYEMADCFDAAAFGAVVLDESSILKGLDGKTRQRLTDQFSRTPYRLCCTATPAPNDITEMANHAAFLGIMSRVEMLAMFFVHDDEGWRLKGHAVEPFFRWLASWAMSVKRPSDLGYSDVGYNLPRLTVTPQWIEADYRPKGMLFATTLRGITDRMQVRRSTLTDRIAATARLINETAGQWIAWCGLNDESDALKRAIPDAVVVEGADSPESKAAALEAFQDGEHRVLITKPKIAGFGMNLQNCHQMVFVGLSDSWEGYYQSIRRCYRFGQSEPVDVHIVLSQQEEPIYANVMRKEAESTTMTERLISQVQEFEAAELGHQPDTWNYTTHEASGEHWRALLGDSVERLAEIADESVGLSVFSPPFMSLYTYSPTERDLGNSADAATFFEHFGYIIRHLLRVTKPGRLAAVHTADVPAMLSRDGYIGLKDFPGQVIAGFEANGWVYHGRVTIDKNPQVQALRTKSKALMFGQTEKDASWSRPGLADYLLLFRKPGDGVPVIPDMTRQEWILWARPVWYAADYRPGTWNPDGGTRKSGDAAGTDGINEIDTLNFARARNDDDERHIAPLQLGTIERCVRLWSNKGDLVLSPFMGIGSEGHVTVTHGRRFVGVELKPEYFRQAVKNLTAAERAAKGGDLFAWGNVDVQHAAHPEA